MPSHLANTLIAQGLLPQDKAEEALRHQSAQGGALDTTLLEYQWLAEAQVLHALGEASGLRPVNLADFEPNAEVASFIPPKIADRLCVVPLSLDGSTLHVACGYPVPRKELEEVGFLLGKSLELWVATEVRVREWISTIYRLPLTPRYSGVLARLDPERMGLSAATPPPPSPPPAAPPPPADPEESSLSMEMLERLARNVASEPVPFERTPEPAPAPPAAAPPATARPAPQPPQQRAPAPVAQAPVAPPPAARPGPAATPPPSAPIREPLRLNMAEPARPTAPPAARPPPAQAAPPPPAVRPAAPPAQAAPPPAARPPPAQAAPPPPTVRPAAPPAQAAPPPAARPPPPAAPPLQAQAPRPAPAPTPAPPLAPAPPPAAAARPAPPPAVEDTAARDARDDVPDWTLAQARTALKESTRDRDRLIDNALRFGRRTFDYVAAFAVLRGSAVGWDSRGEGLGSDALAQVSIPLDVSSVFRTVAVTRGSYVGPMPPDSLTRHYLELFGRQPPRTLFLYPIEVRGRLVAVLYGDCGQKPISQRRLSDYILFCQDLPAAFQELLLFRKQRLGEQRPASGLDFDVDVDVEAPAPGTPAPSAPTPPIASLGWSPFATRAANVPGRAASLAPLVMSQEERPPPDFGPLIKRLTGPDSNQRANAMAELARSPEASARVLASHFPGPSAWSRLPVVELPEADELGPIAGALSRLGRPAAHVLAPLLQSPDADTRYFALLTAGNLPYVELVDGILRGLFDPEPDLSSAARVAAAALKHLPRMDAARGELRQELGHRDASRRALAARALGTLHDRDAIEGLIPLTGGGDDASAQAATDALRELTRATFGHDTRAWTAWWAENRSRRRAEWLVAALRHPDLDIRMVAIEELSRSLNDTLGFYADAPEPEREAAVRRWESVVVDPVRGRRLSLL